MAKATTVEEHLANLPADRRATMEELRRTIRSAAPTSIETIAYSMPAFRTADGRFLLSYDAYKRHYSLFPASADVRAQLGAEIAPYVAGRGTLQFPIGSPVPLDLVRRVVEIRVREKEPADG
jgi:uncharacterized protein YdhG (YjbR/CyaY superfamily)